jgi:WD40 repeat protein
VWDATTGAELLSLKGHTGLVQSAQFSFDGNRIVTADGDTAKVYDARPYSESFAEREAAEAKR